MAFAEALAQTTFSTEVAQRKRSQLELAEACKKSILLGVSFAFMQFGPKVLLLDPVASSW